LLLASFKFYWAFVKPYFQFDEWWTSVNVLVQTLFFRIFILSVANVYIIFQVVLNTLIPVWLIPMLFLGVPLFTYFIPLKKKDLAIRLWIAVAIVPTLVSGVFLLNYFFSSNPVIEEYQFVHGYNETRGRKVMNTMIYLEQDQYDAYLGIRIFSSLEGLAQSEHIIYQFEDGLLGIRVMKHYAFAP
jgi:hypothetical protein